MRNPAARDRSPTDRRAGRCGSDGLAPVVLCLVCALLLQEGAAVAAPAAAQQQARQEFKKGNAAFAKDKYEQALTHYQRAYQLLPLPGFLFNIGQCFRNLGAYDQAIIHYRLYLEKKPDAANRAAVEQLLQDLEQQVASQQPARPSPPVAPPADAAPATRVPTYTPPIEAPPLAKPAGPPPPATAPSRSTPLYKRWWFWTSIAVLAAGGTAAGIYFGIRPGESTLPASPYPVLDFSL